ncbi:MAG TPA: glycosyl hydrolase family 18 protein [Flavilitoribacter sp.]|nr:glycosyl hydrolase family 18 protein [Flavilitoribacter sp.]HMQ88771.1 glycosyl hydrolase family 18 protein [Flavilitoribacter sp.]
MTKRYIILALAVMAAGWFSCTPRENPGPESKNFRVLGYLPSDGHWTAAMAGMDFTRITDLNLAFINPDSTGLFRDNDELPALIDKAHESGVRVFMSIGGGGPPAYLGDLMTEEKRTAFIGAIRDYAVKYRFDGVDVDIENDLINADYAPFVETLYLALEPTGLLMTAALAAWNGDLLADSTLALYDFINIMCYDRTGPWNPEKPGQHSPYEMVEEDFDYYHHIRGIPAGKLLIGLPFYGYGFGPGAPVGMRYGDIVKAYPGAENQDEVALPAGGTIYYNGMPTIRRKVAFAMDKKAAGVMIWQLLGDAEGELSLLNQILLVRDGK